MSGMSYNFKAQNIESMTQLQFIISRHGEVTFHILRGFINIVTTENFPKLVKFK